MRFLIYAIVSLMIALSSLAALAQPRIPDATQEQIDSARGWALLREQIEFNRALFGLWKVPTNCTREILDPSQPPTRFNLVIYCDGPITWCDAKGVDCE